MSERVKEVQLKRVSIRHFRSCVRTEFAPTSRLSCLIGYNGSGKTSVLNGIRLLRAMASPRFAGYSDLPTGQCRIAAEIKYGPVGSLRLRARILFAASETGLDEVINARIKWNFHGVGEADEWVEIPMGATLDRYSDPIVPRLSEPREVQRRVTAFLESVGGPRLRLRAIRGLLAASEYLGSITYYGASQFTNPFRCPASFELSESGRPRGTVLRVRNHVKFLSDLYREYSQKTANYRQFLALVGRDGLGLIDYLKFEVYWLPESEVKVGPGGKIIQKRSRRRIVVPSFILGKTRLSPSQLSEGTYKTLALVFYLVSDRSKLLLLEEPEVCVHHGLLSSVVELIKTFSSEKQIVFTTHSDFVLDALVPDQVFIVERTESRGTKVKPISKVLSVNDFRALKGYLAETGNLGEFWRHGGFAAVH